MILKSNRLALLTFVAFVPFLVINCTKKGVYGPQVADTFPKAGIDLVNHDLRVDMFQVDENGNENLLETLTLQGRMVLERSDPFTNDDQHRQIYFLVKRWEAVGWSDTLQTLVVYRLSEDGEQPMSTITAEQQDRDFPATFSFNVIFDALAHSQVVFRRHHGRPEGGKFLVVPPNGIRKMSPTITQFEDQIIEVTHPQLGLLRFRPKDCNDQNSQTLVSFQDGGRLNP